MKPTIVPPAARRGIPSAAGPMSQRKPAVTPHFISAMMIAALLLGLFVALSSFLPRQEKVSLLGVVNAERNRATVRSDGSGVLSAVHVRAGDIVAAGSLLAEVVDERLQAENARHQRRLTELLATKARFEAELAEREIEADDPGLVDPPIWRKLVADQRRILADIRHLLANMAAHEESLIAQANREAVVADEQAAAAQKQVDQLRQELADLRRRQRPNRTTRFRIEALETKISQREAEIQGTRHLADKQRTAIRMRQLNADEGRLTRRNEASAVLQAIVHEIESLDATRRGIAESNGYWAIRMPMDGRVVKMESATPGMVVRNGQVLFDVESTSEDLVIEARVPVGERSSISPGQTAQIRLLGFTQRLPLLEGGVLSVGSDLQRDAKTDRQYFVARLRADPPARPLPAGAQMIPGMPVAVVVATGRSSVLGQLLAPIQPAMAGGSAPR